MNMQALSRWPGSVARICAAALSLAGLAHSPAAGADRCEALCTEAFWQSASAGDIEAALARGAPIDAVDENGATPLHWAAADGRGPAVAALLAAGAEVDARTYGGSRPLHWWAYRNGAAPVLEAFLAAGANIHVRDGLGYSPLHTAAEAPNLLSVRTLLDAGANVDAEDRYGAAPLLMAASRGHVAVVEALLDAGADVNRRGAVFAHSEDERHDVTALHMAAMEGALEVAELLLERGAEVNALAYNTPFDDAVRQGHEAMQALLRRHGGVVRRAVNAKDVRSSVRGRVSPGPSLTPHLRRERRMENVPAGLRLTPVARTRVGEQVSKAPFGALTSIVIEAVVAHAEQAPSLAAAADAYGATRGSHLTARTAEHAGGGCHVP